MAVRDVASERESVEVELSVILDTLRSTDLGSRPVNVLERLSRAAAQRTHTLRR